MPVFSVVTDLCRQDGICASVCPAHVIKGPKDHLPFMRPGAEDNCIACGQCMAFCPHGAARVDVLPLEDMRRIERKRLPDAGSLDNLLRSRRSIRHFKEEPLPRELLQEILASSRYAPSAKNRRPARWIVAYEREKLQAIGNCMVEWLEGKDADGNPLMPEAKGLARAWRAGMDPLFRGAPHLVLAVTGKDASWTEADAAIALTYVELAALPHNVGCCWAGYIAAAARAYKPLQDLLGIADGEVCQGGQMLGFISLRPTASAPRVPYPVQWL